MEDDRIKFFHEQYPDVFQGADALIESKLKQRESDVDSLIDGKLRAREFRESLKKAYPNWEQVWHSKEFQEFLNEEHELTGVPNYAFIESHFQNLNSQGAISFFKTFFDRQKKEPDYSAPSRSGSGFAEITRAREQLKKLRDEKSRGQWANREAEFRKKCNDLIRTITGQAK